VNPRGPTPHAVAQVDDLVFDLHCSADAQVDNTHAMLAQFPAIFRDGRVGDEDTDEILFLLKHARLEHRWNAEQLSGMKLLRALVNPLFELVATLRSQMQAARQQARG
jgi:hypothetical protein